MFNCFIEIATVINSIYSRQHCFCNIYNTLINLHYTFSIKLDRFCKHLQPSITFYIPEWSTLLCPRCSVKALTTFTLLGCKFCQQQTL